MQVAAESVRKFRPNAKLVAHHSNIKVGPAHAHALQHERTFMDTRLREYWHRIQTTSKCNTLPHAPPVATKQTIRQIYIDSVYK